MRDEKLDQILKQALAPQIDDSEIIVHKKMRKKREKGMNRKNRISRFPMAAAIILAILIGTGGTVYAVFQYFGLLDFTDHLKEKIPQEAVELIEREIAQTPIEDGRNTFINLSVKEALCDSETIMIVYEVSAEESGKYLFIPEDATFGSNMSDWSNITGISAGEYAKQNNLEIINIGGGIVNRDELGIVESSMSFKSVSNDVMYVYVRSGKMSDVRHFDVTCVATARPSEAGSVNDVIRQEVKFTLEDMSEADIFSYLPVGQTGHDTETEIVGAQVIQTELGTYIDVHFHNNQGNFPDNISFRIKESDGTGIDSIGGSGIEVNEDGTYRERLILNKKDFSGDFILEIYDYHEGTIYNSMQMRLESKGYNN